MTPQQLLKNNMRLQRFIALNSEYSRRKAEELILQGRVSVNGKTVRKLGTKVEPETNPDVAIDDEPLKIQKEKIYFVLNKPSGYISTRNDTHGRKTVMDLIPNKDVHPVGRLDKDTEGMLILTNDGDFSFKITHPKFEKEKEYVVRCKNPITNEQKEKLEKGVRIEGKKTAPCTVKNKPHSGKCTIILHEGKKRQIRRMFEEIENPVIYLKRIRIGNVKLGTLPKGSFRLLSKSEVKNLLK